MFQARIPGRTSEFVYKHNPALSMEEAFPLERVRTHQALPLLLKLISLAAVKDCRILTPEDFNEPKFKQVQWLLNFDTDASLLCNEHMMKKLQSNLQEKTG